MTNEIIFRVSIKSDDLIALINELQLFVAEISNRTSKVGEAFIDRFGSLVEFGGIDFDVDTTAGAGILLLRPNLTDAFREFMAAARAGEFDVK